MKIILSEPKVANMWGDSLLEWGGFSLPKLKNPWNSQNPQLFFSSRIFKNSGDVQHHDLFLEQTKTLKLLLWLLKRKIGLNAVCFAPHEYCSVAHLLSELARLLLCSPAASNRPKGISKWWYIVDDFCAFRYHEGRIISIKGFVNHLVFCYWNQKLTKPQKVDFIEVVLATRSGKFTWQWSNPSFVNVFPLWKKRGMFH